MSKKFVSTRVSSAEDFIDRISDHVLNLPLQVQYALLRCCAISQITHLTRTNRPLLSMDSLERYDQKVLGAVTQLMKAPSSSLSQSAREQVHQPLRLGGLGLPSSPLTSLAAFPASIIGAASDMPNVPFPLPSFVEALSCLDRLKCLFPSFSRSDYPTTIPNFRSLSSKIPPKGSNTELWPPSK